MEKKCGGDVACAERLKIWLTFENWKMELTILQ
jgi:hypothetical protein